MEHSEETAQPKEKIIENIVQIWYRQVDIKNIRSRLVDFMPKRVSGIIKTRGVLFFY